MKITDVVALQMRVREVEDVFDGTQDVLIVEVRTDDGLSGFGEVVSSSYVARAAILAPRSGGGRHGLAEIVRGMDPTDTQAVWQAMYEGTAWYGRRGLAIHAMAGVDVALWDLKAKAAGKPLYRMLNGSARSRKIQAYASVLWGNTLAETEALAREFREAGFDAVKFGFGPIGTSTAGDVRMVQAARNALGDSAALLVDVGRRWNVGRSLEAATAFVPYRVGWIEEPLHPDDLEGYARLTAASPIPIAGGETEETVAQFRAYLDAGLKVIQPDVGRVGLSQALEISELAKHYGAKCVPHCFGSGVNTTAAIHWMAATGGDLVEYPRRMNALCRELAIGVPPIVDGFVSPGEAPGLGIELNKLVARHYEYLGARPTALV